jgi:transcriptional regulator with XRE-family HTH domain
MARLPSGKTAAAARQKTVSVGLGTRLREAREEKGFTLRGLARTIGVSPSLISQVEHGHIMPSVATLCAVANQLDLVVDDLFKKRRRRASAARRATGGPRETVQRRQGRSTLRLAQGIRWERLTPGPDPEVEFLYVVYEVGAESCDEKSLIQHGGTEYAYVMAGRLGLKIRFDEFELRPGDSITFDARDPHRLWTIGKTPVEAIWVVHNRHGDGRQQTGD